MASKIAKVETGRVPEYMIDLSSRLICFLFISILPPRRKSRRCLDAGVPLLTILGGVKAVLGLFLRCKEGERESE